MMKKYHRHVGVILFLVLVFCVMFLCRSFNCKRNVKPTAIQSDANSESVLFLTQLFEIKKGYFADTVHLLAEVRGLEDVDVRAVKQCDIDEFLFKEGDFVNAGDIIANVDADKERFKKEHAYVEYQDHQKLYKMGGCSKSSLEKTRLEYELANKEYEELMIRAPFSGLLGKRYVEPKQTVSSMQKIVRVTNIDSVRITCEVSEYELPKIKKGQKVYVSASAYPDFKFHGVVDEVSGILNQQTRRSDVKIIVTNQDRKLVPGMFLGVDIVVFEKDSLFSLPIEAVVRKDEKYCVYIIEPIVDKESCGIIRLKMVQPVYVSDQRVYSEEGFKDGELAVINPENLYEGQRVEY